MSTTQPAISNISKEEKLRREYQKMTIGFVAISAVCVCLFLMVLENPMIIQLISSKFRSEVVEKRVEVPVIADTATPMPFVDKQQVLESNLSPQYEIVVDAKESYHLARLQDKETHTAIFEEPLPLAALFVKNFFFNDEQKSLYVVEGTGPYGEAYEELSKIEYQAGNYSKKLLLHKKSKLYERTEILRVYSDDQIALVTQGGDACSGSGYASILENGVDRRIKDFALGNGEPQLPRFIGFHNDRWYFYSVGQEIIPQIQPGCPNYPAREIFTMSASSDVPEALLLEADMPKNVAYIRFSKDEPNLLYLLTEDSQMYQYNLLTKTLGSSDKDPSEFFSITGN